MVKNIITLNSIPLESFTSKGFKRIEANCAHGNEMNGYYTWAQFGFEMKDFNEIGESQIERLKKYLQQPNTPDKIKHCTSLQTKNGKFGIMDFKEGQRWWKENGFSFDGYFDMQKNSECGAEINMIG